MKINFYFRHSKIGFSIENVFGLLIEELNNKVDCLVIKMPSKFAKPWDVLKNNVYTLKFRNKNAIHHITGHIHDVALALIGLKTVLTIHDLVFLDNVKNPIKRFYKWLFWFYLPLKIADKVVCVSEKTKRNIESRIKTNKLSVIYNPINPIFEFSPKEFNCIKPVVLHIGTGWNKNLALTIKALEGINCHLRIVGKLSKDLKEQLENSTIEYSNVFNLSNDEIKNEYINCDLVNFPSIYEGFGMPIIEGQAIGRVVVASKIEPLIEVSGCAVAFVEPNNIHSLKSTYQKLIDDSALREDLISKGQENCKRFSVQSIATQYLDLYKSLLI